MSPAGEFDTLLRSWMDESARSAQPEGLLESVLTATAHTRPRPAWLVRLGGEPVPEPGHSGMNRFAPLAVAATVLVVSILIGFAVFVRLSSDVGPSPLPGPTHEATPRPTRTPPDVPLGGGLILVYEAYDESNPGPLDLFTLDAQTGERTLLGTLPRSGVPLARYNRYDLQWGLDHDHVLITDSNGEGPKALDHQTDAARELNVVCCEPPDEVVPNPAKGEGETRAIPAASAWVMAPQSDRLAGLRDRQIHLAGCLECSAPGAIVILDIDTGNLSTIPLPDGTQADREISWSPDGSAVVLSGCRPCNNASLSAGAGLPEASPAVVEHAHLFVVPIDGSPVRELLDEAEAMFGAPAWSPDGTTIAFARHKCPPAEHAPDCLAGTDTLATVVVADGRQTLVEKGIPHVYGPMWSPDGRRIAFNDDDGVFVMDADGSHVVRLIDGYEPRWSPDGQWILVSSSFNSATKLTVIAADGGEKHVLGTYGGGAW
jgi:hypothetical protein